MIVTDDRRLSLVEPLDDHPSEGTARSGKMGNQRCHASLGA